MRVTTSKCEISGKNSRLLSQTCLPPKHNLPVRENNSLQQAAFWHEVEVV